MFSLHTYFLVYSFLLISYLWYRYFGIIVPNKRRYKKGNYFFSIIIPTFNEELDILEKTIKSALECKGRKEVIVVDDGSTNNTKEFLKGLQKKYDFRYFSYPNNKGKRYAQVVGFKKTKGDILITLDSDTVLYKNSLLDISRPFSNVDIGGVTGIVDVANKNQNLLTKLINSRYWSAFNFERMSQSNLGGIVTCCCGSFSAYKKKYVIPLLDAYVNQTFMGRNCNFGDDRHLTNLLLEKYKVVVADARASTFAPFTLAKFINQQIRWSQSFIRENFITLKYMFKRSGFLSFDILSTSIFPIFGLGIRLSMVMFIFIYPRTTIPFYIFTILYMSLFRNLTLFGKKKWSILFYNLIYGFFHTFLVYWLYFPALYKVFIQRTRSWGTR